MKNLIYKVIPTDTFKISRGCGGCGCKQNFVSRKTFRVNANGNKLDVWMIYGCEKCNHTYNLPVYERIRPDRMNKEEYQKFLANDEEAIFQYGTNKSIFTQNKAEIVWEECNYTIENISEELHSNTQENQIQNADGTVQNMTGFEDNDSVRKINLKLQNPYAIPFRKEKIAAEILHISRSQVKKLLDSEQLTVEII